MPTPPPHPTWPIYVALALSCIAILLTLIGWLVVPRITHALAIRREREAQERAAAEAKRARKQAFIAAITFLRDTVLAAKNSELIEAHNQSLPRFREECAKIEPDISDKADFRTSREVYLSLTNEEIECPDQSEKPPPNEDRFGNYVAGGINWKPRCRYELGRQRIKVLLDRICEHAK